MSQSINTMSASTYNSEHVNQLKGGRG